MCGIPFPIHRDRATRGRVPELRAPSSKSGSDCRRSDSDSDSDSDSYKNRRKQVQHKNATISFEFDKLAEL